MAQSKQEKVVPQGTEESVSQSGPLPRQWWKIYILAWLPLGFAYLIILGAFANVTGRTLLTTWVANVLYPSIASLGIVWFTLRVLIGKKIQTHLVAHTIGAVAFSTLWLLVVFRLLQFFGGVFTGEWVTPNWQSPVVAWQLFQGLAIYFVVASGTYAYWALSRLEHIHASQAEKRAPSRLYAKDDAGFVPVSIEEIVLVRTIDGITYVFAGPKKLESRLSLSELEQILPGEAFARVHRTAIVNLDLIESVEAAGNGRQTVRMSNGQVIETSRSGSSELKSRFAIV